jgi:anti-sigma factor RsiW
MCPEQEILSAFLDGEVEPPWESKIEEHIAGCKSCRRALSRLEETRSLLQAERPGEWREPMERVRRRLLAQSVRRPNVLPVWKRRVSLPLPLAAAAAAAVLILATALSFALFRSNVGMVRITKAPAGNTEIQIAAPIGALEGLLKSIDSQDSNSDVITLPKKFHLIPVGEPLMGKEAEFLRK